MKKKLVFYLYNRLNDPLIQSNIFLYIMSVASKSPRDYQIVIITFEDKQFEISTEEMIKFSNMFKEYNIQWISLRWTKGDQLHRKMLDLIKSFFVILYLRWKGYKHFVTLGTIAGSFMYMISRIIPLNYYLYQYEPHSEYALDNNIWSPHSRQYKFLNYFEKKSAFSAKIISSGTDFMRNRLMEWKVKAKFFKIASVVNDKKFSYSAEERVKFRNKLGIPLDRKVILYPGKLGDLYCSPDQLLKVLSSLADTVSSSFFVIITPSFSELKQELVEFPQLIDKILFMPPVDHSEMPGYLSMADLGIIAVLPGPSKKFVSNIKVGEYLCSGLPYLICKGISEDDLVAETYRVGVVLNSFNGESVIKQQAELQELLSVEKEEMASRCRQVGLSYRGFDIHFKEFTRALECFFR